MRKLTVTLLLIVSMLVLAACSSNGSEVVVKSKAGDITKDDFYEELKDNIGEEVLEEMVLVKVLEDKYEVKDEEVDEEVDKIKEQLGEQFDMWLEQQQIADEDEFRKTMRISMLYQEAIYGNVEVSEDEVKERYERMKSEIEAQHILVTEEDEANDIKKKLDDGESFEDLAKDFSIDGSAEDGGALGYFSAGQMVSEFEDAAYTLEIDEISDPVKSEHGFHIIKVTDKRDAEVELGTFEEMEEEITNAIKATKVGQEEGQGKIDKLIEEANVDIKIENFKDLFDNKEE